MINHNYKLIGKSLLLIILCIGLGLILLMSVFTLPTNLIEKNVIKSAETFEEEGVYPQISVFGITSLLDNWTDAIMLCNAAYSSTNISLIDRTISVYRINVEEAENPAQVLVSYYSESNNGNDIGNISISSYSRYWHGYLVLLKPLLLCFTYSQIRIMNTIMQGLLCVLLIFIMAYKKLKKIYF